MGFEVVSQTHLSVRETCVYRLVDEDDVMPNIPTVIIGFQCQILLDVVGPILWTTHLGSETRESAL